MHKLRVKINLLWTTEVVIPAFSSIQIQCKQCGKSTLVQPHRFKSGGGKYCSPKCYQESRNPPEIRECLICKKELKSYVCTKQKYCSLECGNKGKMKNRHKRAGYIFLYRPEHPRKGTKFNGKSGYIREHILVVEEHLGRYLEEGETVHHVNAKRADNRIENLYLFPSNSAHISYHMRVKYGKCEEITQSNLT